MELTVIEECKGLEVSTSLLVMTKRASIVVLCLNLKLSIFVQRLWLHSPWQMSGCMSFFKVLSAQKERGLKSLEQGILRAYLTQLLKGMIPRVHII